LERVDIHEGVNSLGLYVFKNCKALSSILIPDSVRKIDSYTFQDCTSLTNVTISDAQILKLWDTFYGSPWYSNRYQEQLSKGICPSCGSAISVFKKCKSCGKKYS